MDKNKILIIIFILLMASSAILLYRSFGRGPLKLLSAPPQQIAPDTSIRTEINSLDETIKKGIKKVEAGGDLDTLLNSKQFSELSSDGLKDIVVDPRTQGRANPFIPVDYEI